MIVLIRLILEPRAAVWDNRGGEKLFAGFVVTHPIIHAGGTHELGNDHALRAVNHKSAAIRHEREVAHIHFVLFDLACFLVDEPRTHTHRRRIGRIALFALRNSIFRLIVHTVADKIQHKITGVIRDLRNIAEDLLEPFVQEPLVGILLHLDEIGHLHNLVDPPEAHAGIVAKLNRFHFHHRLITPFFFYPQGYWFVLSGER